MIRQKGVALTEFLIVGPLVLFMGLAGIQYALIYNAKLNVTYAAYEAARAGALANADTSKIEDAFYKGLVPFYSTTGIYLPGNIHIRSPFKAGLSSSNDATLAAGGWALREAIKKTESAFVGVHMVNPSKASFDDWSDPVLQKAYLIKAGVNTRIIPNRDLAIKDKGTIKQKSKQTLSDANVLKLRITYGYEPRVPMMRKVFSAVTSFFGSQRDSVSARILASGRIPIVVDMSAQMLSPPIERNLPASTVNRSGFLVNQQLVDKVVENEAMKWQVGYEDDLLDNLRGDAQNQLISNLTSAVNENSNGIGSALVGSAGSVLKDLLVTNGQTGHGAGAGTRSIIGDTDGLFSCSSEEETINFF